ncbi:MAG: hypothetical protein DRJ13_13710, partial [Bacteroidetes bacterium]
MKPHHPVGQIVTFLKLQVGLREKQIIEDKKFNKSLLIGFGLLLLVLVLVFAFYTYWHDTQY